VVPAAQAAAISALEAVVYALAIPGLLLLRDPLVKFQVWVDCCQKLSRLLYQSLVVAAIQLV
jgi:hypothetical protein